MKRLLALALTTVLLVLGEPAMAEDTVAERQQDVALSADGVHYQDDLDLALFDSQVRWVPGDVRDSSFWVRNQAPEAGDLSIDLLARNRMDLFDSGYLSVAARAGDGPWRTVKGPDSMRLLTQNDLPAKSALPVTIRVSLAAAAPNGTMLVGTDLDLGITLTDARASDPSVASDDSDGPGGLLPATGAALVWWVARFGLLLLLAGALLLFLSRSHDQPSTTHAPGENR